MRELLCGHFNRDLWPGTRNRVRAVQPGKQRQMERMQGGGGGGDQAMMWADECRPRCLTQGVPYRRIAARLRASL